jgi:O-acetyl-ADP-ribose deacetylase (regulator of RNase III)
VTVEYRVGDLFASELPALGHGCNCGGRMGKGIAVEFRRRWPGMFDEYQRRCAQGAFGLGDVFVWEAEDRVIFNLGTQETWRTQAELWAIESSVARMIEWAEQHSIPSIGLPRIGAGLGALPWHDVAPAIESKVSGSAVDVVIFELPPPQT